MNGYGSHTYSLINADNQRVWCKFHLKTMQGMEFLTDEEGTRLVGRDRDSHQRDLYHAIENGDCPRWRMCVQVMTDDQAASSPFDPFDLTKVWPHGDFPLIEVGVVELNRNPDNYFAEVEQAAFSPANQVPGISHSPDKVLQFRIFAYADAHRHRLGVDYEKLPVNQGRAPVSSSLPDGSVGAAARAADELDSRGGLADHHVHPVPPPVIEGPRDRSNQRAGNDDYTQPGNLFRLMTPGAAGAAVRQPGPRDGRGAGGDPAPPSRPLQQGRSRLRGRGGARPGAVPGPVRQTGDGPSWDSACRPRLAGVPPSST